MDGCMESWLHSWLFSFLIVLHIVGLLMGFGTFVYVLIYRIWGEENDREETPSLRIMKWRKSQQSGGRRAAGAGQARNTPS
jgi:hypothetical protein